MPPSASIQAQQKAVAAATAQREHEKRLRARARRAARLRRENQGLYPGLNDFSDALEAIPMEVIRHFTLLREIDAKCISTVPVLNRLIARFFELPDEPANATVAQEREECLAEIRRLIRELMPCQEEKMHVAGVAADLIARHVQRIDHDFELISANEVPERVQAGPETHPAVQNDTKTAPEAPKGSTRSESRREAIAAKRAAQAAQAAVPGSGGGAALPGSGVNSGTESGRVGRTSTPINGPGAGRSGVGGAMPAATATTRGQVRSGSNGTPVNPPPTKRRRVNNSTATDEEYEQPGEARAAAGISRPGTPNGAAAANNNGTTRRTNRGGRGSKPVKEEDKLYCHCQNISYGEMVGCDGPDCKYEWFHLPCIGLEEPPKGQWFCDACAEKYRRRR
ncbi:transcriptional regulatory protein Pho23p [Trichomonascus vanleenenianus]|uniref:Pho23p n=1 Tax=Trichomonascus vanleenenianus TaxID=2268995 RepID=UPI003ECA0E3A